MNEENTTVETTEEIAQIEAAFDEDWNEDSPVDDDMNLSDEAEPETETAPAEDTEPAEAEQTEAEPEETKEAEPEKQPETGNQRFKLKHLGEVSEVDLDTVIELAQKGMDYDHVREERDNLKEDSATLAKLKGYETFLKELAESGKEPLTIEQLIENTRARMLMSNDENLTEEEALAKVREANKATEKKEEPKAEATPEERRQAMFASFLAAYPNVKAEEIPQEVWEDAGRTYDLNGAYQRWENRQLRKELETLRQNQKNKERSTGSRRSVGAAKVADDFDAGWDSEF